MNPRSTDCEADALTTTPSRRYTRDKLLLVQQENALLTCCKEFQKKFGDIDSDEMSAELQRFVLILQKNAISIRLKTF